MKRYVVCAILLVGALICASYSCSGRGTEFSLKIFGGKDMIGASVYIDGTFVGKMEKFGDGSYFSKWLPHGTHKIKIKQFEEEFSVQKGESEYYIEVKETSKGSGRNDAH